MPYKVIAGMIPTIQAAHLVSENVKTIKKKKQSTEDMLDLGMKNIVGVSMIKISSDIVKTL